MAKVSIGVPVYNGGALLAESLECLRRQTFADFEVIVSDNASSDDSRAVAEDFASRDPRFRVVSQPENLGAVGNFLATLEAASAPCFMWRAHDDLSAPNYVETLHRLLTGNPQAVLAVGVIASADLEGNKPRRRHFPELAGRIPCADSMRLLFRAHPSWYYGLWRTDYLREAFPRVVEAYPHPWAQDHLLLFSVLLRRAVVGTSETVFHQRRRVVVRDKARRRREAVSPDIRVMQRRQFHDACLAELAQLEGLPVLDRLVTRALLPFYVNKRVHRLSKVIKGYLRQHRQSGGVSRPA